MGLQLRKQVVHLVVQPEGVVQKAVVDGRGTAGQQVVHRVLVADREVGLRCDRVLGGACDACETADKMSLDDSRTYERVTVIDVLHYDLVTGGEVIYVGAVARARGLSELSGSMDRHRSPVGNLDVEVASEVVAVEQGPGICPEVMEVVGDTLLAEVSE